MVPARITIVVATLLLLAAMLGTSGCARRIRYSEALAQPIISIPHVPAGPVIPPSPPAWGHFGQPVLGVVTPLHVSYPPDPADLREVPMIVTGWEESLFDRNLSVVTEGSWVMLQVADDGRLPGGGRFLKLFFNNAYFAIPHATGTTLILRFTAAGVFYDLKGAQDFYRVVPLWPEGGHC